MDDLEPTFHVTISPGITDHIHVEIEGYSNEEFEQFTDELTDHMAREGWVNYRD
jgi:hypothetical protein